MKSLSFKNQLLLVYSIVVLIAAVLVYILFTSINETDIKNISHKHFEEKTLQLEKQFHEFFIPYFTTIRAIKSNPLFIDFVSQNDNKESVENLFLAIKNGLPCLMKVRFIDNNGNEKIRIDGKPIILDPQLKTLKVVQKMICKIK